MPASGGIPPAIVCALGDKSAIWLAHDPVVVPGVLGVVSNATWVTHVRLIAQFQFQQVHIMDGIEILPELKLGTHKNDCKSKDSVKPGL